MSSLGSGHAHDDDADDDDDADPDPRDPRNTYAGGEKSGLAVQDPSQRSDPKKLLNDIIAKARRYVLLLSPLLFASIALRANG